MSAPNATPVVFANVPAATAAAPAVTPVAAPAASKKPAKATPYDGLPIIKHERASYFAVESEKIIGADGEQEIIYCVPKALIRFYGNVDATGLVGGKHGVFGNAPVTFATRNGCFTGRANACTLADSTRPRDNATNTPAFEQASLRHATYGQIYTLFNQAFDLFANNAPDADAKYVKILETIRTMSIALEEQLKVVVVISPTKPVEVKHLDDATAASRSAKTGWTHSKTTAKVGDLIRRAADPKALAQLVTMETYIKYTIDNLQVVLEALKACDVTLLESLPAQIAAQNKATANEKPEATEPKAAKTPKAKQPKEPKAPKAPKAKADKTKATQESLDLIAAIMQPAASATTTATTSTVQAEEGQALNVSSDSVGTASSGTDEQQILEAAPELPSTQEVQAAVLFDLAEAAAEAEPETLPMDYNNGVQTNIVDADALNVNAPDIQLVSSPVSSFVDDTAMVDESLVAQTTSQEEVAPAVPSQEAAHAVGKRRRNELSVAPSPRRAAPRPRRTPLDL